MDFRPWGLSEDARFFENHVPGRAGTPTWLTEGMPGRVVCNKQTGQIDGSSQHQIRTAGLVPSPTHHPWDRDSDTVLLCRCNSITQPWLPCVQMRRCVLPWVRNLLRIPQTALRDIRWCVVCLTSRCPSIRIVPRPKASSLYHLLRSWAAMVGALSDLMQARLDFVPVSACGLEINMMLGGGSAAGLSTTVLGAHTRPVLYKYATGNVPIRRARSPPPGERSKACAALSLILCNQIRVRVMYSLFLLYFFFWFCKQRRAASRCLICCPLVDGLRVMAAHAVPTGVGVASGFGQS